MLCPAESVPRNSLDIRRGMVLDLDGPATSGPRLDAGLEKGLNSQRLANVILLVVQQYGMHNVDYEMRYNNNQ